MQKNEMGILIQKYLNNQLTREDFEELKLWIEADSSHKETFVKLLSLHHVNNQLNSLYQFDEEASWTSLLKRRNRNRMMRRVAIYSSVATIALLVGVSSLLYFNNSEATQPTVKEKVVAAEHTGNPKATLVLADNSEISLYQNQLEVNGLQIIDRVNTSPRELKSNAVKVAPDAKLLQNQIKVPRGSEYSIVLADGTKVKMNADSHLDFPVVFDKVRDVTLSGEAYFDVNHDEARPFVVKAGDHIVYVLGTVFNIMAYPGEAVCITLVSGKIKVIAPTGEYFLSAGEQYTSRNASIQKVEADTYVSWTNGEMEFDAMPLPELLIKLSRWYNVDLKLASKKLEKRKFTGVIFRNKPLNFALDILHRVSDVQFEQKGKTIYVKE